MQPTTTGQFYGGQLNNGIAPVAGYSNSAPASTYANTTQSGTNAIPTTQAAGNAYVTPSLNPQNGSTTSQTSQTNTTPSTAINGTSTNGTTPNTSPQLSDPTDRAALDASVQASQQAAQNFSDTITNIQNGVIPLSVGDQAQVQGLQSQFQNLITQQTQNNNQAQGSAMTSAFRGGAGVGSDVMNNISAVVSAGAQKVATLQSQEASAVAQLTQSLKDNDISKIKEAYDALNDAQKNSQAALQKTIDDTTKAISDAQAENDKQQQYQLDIQKFNADLQNQAFNQNLDTQKFAETLKSDAFDRAYKQEDLALKSQANQIAGQTNVPAVSVGADGKPDAQSQANFLASLPGGATGALATGVKGLTSYQILPNTFSTRAVNGAPSQKQQFVTLAEQYDPTYDENLAPARAAYLKNLASAQAGTVGGAIISANTAVNHLSTFINLVSKLPNGPSSTLNAVDNAVTFNQGVRTNIKAAQGAGLGVADELAKFFKGTGSTDVSSVDAWKSQLSTNASPADVKGLTQGALDLLAGRLETLSEQYTNTLGKPPANGFLGTSAMASLSTLKNEGYTVNIPGILYTDPTAYVKNDPQGAANLKQVISAYPNLSQADALQLAQSLQ